MSDELSPRARAILEAAERLASGRRPPPAPPEVRLAAPAEQPAPPEAQLAALAEQVRVTVETVRARVDELTARIDALTAQLVAQSAAPPPLPPPARPVPEPLPPPLPPTPDPDDAPRLLAVELAVAGATRADVDARLRERFGVSSTALLLDEVFGVGSSPGARLPWGGS